MLSSVPPHMLPRKLPFIGLAILCIYQCICLLCSPIILIYLAWRSYKSTEQTIRIKERFGFSSKKLFKDDKDRVIWLHAASVGETAALSSIITTILSESKSNILVTTATVTACELLHKRFGRAIQSGRLAHQYTVLDIPWAVNRFLNRWRPELFLVCESEIWPIRILELSRRGIPQIIVSATLSKKSAKNWCKVPILSRIIFSRFSLVLCQNADIEARYLALGAKNTYVTGNLKADIGVSPDESTLNILKSIFAKRVVFAAVSTHDGEEKILLESYRKLRQKQPNLAMILVPRHPQRFEKVAELIKQEGFNFIRKTQLDTMPAKVNYDILLGDTIGDMGLYLTCASIVFIGKSLILPGGGHNPLEAAMLRKPIISGGYVGNFTEIYELLKQRDAILFADSASELCQHIEILLADHSAYRQMTDRAENCVTELAGATAKTILALQPYIATMETMEAL